VKPNAGQRIDESYQRGQESLERRRLGARRGFVHSASSRSENSTRVDAALYWKAYALDKLNQQADALVRSAGSHQALSAEPLDQRRRRRSSSRCRQNAGQSPRPQANRDEELKLLAIQGLQQADPEQAVPIAREDPPGTASPSSSRARCSCLRRATRRAPRQVLTARGQGRIEFPTCSAARFNTWRQHGSSREPRHPRAEIYASSSDVDIKRAILRSFMVSGDKARMLEPWPHREEPGPSPGGRAAARPDGRA
jgi:hypothetical protein